MAWISGTPVEMETDRFFVRSLTQRDADDNYTSWWNDVEIQRGFNRAPRSWDKARAAKHISSFNNVNRFHLGIFFKETEKLIGFITIVSNPKSLTGTTNVCLGDKSFWGQNVIVEARTQMMDFIFNTLGMQKVESKIIGRNFSSIFNNKVLGYTAEGIVRKNVPAVDGGRADTYLYGLLKEEWQQKNKPHKQTETLDQNLLKSKSFQTAKTLLAEATYNDPKDIPDNAAVDTWGAWDSLSHVRLLLAIEGHLGCELKPDAIIHISSLSDISGFISNPGSGT